MRAGKLTSNVSLYLILGFLIGLIIGDPTGHSGPISMLLLGVMMTISMSDLTLSKQSALRDISLGVRPALMCFGALTAVFLLASLFFEGDFKTGWIMAAAMPAGIMIVPYSSILGANVRLALYGEIVIYVIALVITPVIAIAFMGTGVDPIDLIVILLILILAPLGLSRSKIFSRTRLETRELSMNIVILLFFIIVVGANRAVFFEETDIIFGLIAASFATIFGTGLLVDKLLNRLPGEDRMVLTMFATIKNTGLAIAVCLILFPKQAAMPPTMLVIFEIIWVMFLISWKYR